MEPLTLLMRESRLRWYRHMKRRKGDGVLGKAMEIEVPGTRPRGRPKKTWMKNIYEDMCEWNMIADVYGRVRGRALIKI